MKKTLLLGLLACAYTACTEPKPGAAIAPKAEKPQVQTQGYSALFLSGRFYPSKNPEFSPVPAKYSVRDGLYLQKKTITAFEKMAKAAQKEGINLYILSATRDFRSQKGIWEAKFNGNRLTEGKNLAKEIADHRQRSLFILRYSSMPGTSRHHWGTDFDISFHKTNVSRMLSNTTYESGEGLKVYNWMRKNAPSFGFCQPYEGSPSSRQPGFDHGYLEEKWHWSYKPLSRELTKSFANQKADLLPRDFAGSESVKDLYLDYVLNISSSCL